jgi:hypothetical protein
MGTNFHILRSYIREEEIHEKGSGAESIVAKN